MFIKVDFPDPEEPMTETNSPAAMERLTPFKAGISISPT
jgi:hypothetical protein